MFLKHFRVSIGLNLYWSPILEALLEMKKKNTKYTTKYSQYNVIMTVINEFQQLNLFVFELHFYVIGNMSVKPIVKFMIYLASLLKKKYQLFKKCYIYKKFWAFYGGR